MTAPAKHPDSARRAAFHAMHMGIAETGKMRAVAGDHIDAMRHYREALRLAQGSGAPEVFFRHYTQCVLESLEQTGAHAEVIDFCENALAHFERIETPLALHHRDHAATLERYALNLLKSGRPKDARAALDKAMPLVKRGDLPIAHTILDWLRRGMTPDARRITDLQRKHGYWTVRADTLDPARAVPLPEHAGAPAMT